ncbi:4-(cytidine 5'-diphospho)-2-C-methyl-D-erythritol kinase [Petrocella atlantisensis]|uniref:4-diphosphocytidyl-2-C-methyl-D-erythritol kinase n=1 Tax=Petrocella atlantisensis TaxID=2173034 RepID=A0A3P7NYP8_9FIRM|nr:4-(cytidine 5'-diphospho)-2-C-methyl-D-erythritol kinase [Petrocella atlantisensis]VDN48105.1 4-(cytidine 5'-diphospho)-2-C-methyl-D-erythritol kinase [Petrocella atlantisensis]
MKEVKRKARAKINLALDVIGKRENGYHDVRMVMQTIELHDKVRLKKIKSDKILMKTNLPYLPRDNRNLVYQVVEYMKTTYGIKSGVYIDLYKVIPVGAGLAGGSTDAAQSVLGMNELFELGLNIETMEEIGAKFGADIPYCIRGGTMIAEGIGEILTPIKPIMKLHLLIVKPKQSVSTAYVYGNLDVMTISNHPNIDAMVRGIEEDHMGQIVQNLGNVLEEVTFRGYPEVKMIKEAIFNNAALGALMSGSGSAVFGIFEDQGMAHQAAKKLKRLEEVKQVFVTTTYNVQ